MDFIIDHPMFGRWIPSVREEKGGKSKRWQKSGIEEKIGTGRVGCCTVLYCSWWEWNWFSCAPRVTFYSASGRFDRGEKIGNLNWALFYDL